MNIRDFVARFDVNNPSSSISALTPSERKETVGRNTIDAVLEGVNAFFAGTPVTWVSAPLTIVVGCVKYAAALLTPRTSDDASALRKSAMKSLIAGITAPIPVVGSMVNGPLAALDTIDFVNTAVPTGSKKA